MIHKSWSLGILMGQTLLPQRIILWMDLITRSYFILDYTHTPTHTQKRARERFQRFIVNIYKMSVIKKTITELSKHCQLLVNLCSKLTI